MNNKIMHLFTRTPLHVGAGSSVGAIDQPVRRERHSGFPLIPGSAIKGVFADEYLEKEEDGWKRSTEGTKLFGTEIANDENASAGSISFGEARLLAFPLRSAKGSFALATSPLALSRYARDTGIKHVVSQIEDDKCLANSFVSLEKSQVILEEYVFTKAGDFPKEWAEHLSKVLNDDVLNKSKERFVLLSDGDFSHFAMNACQVEQHNRIDDKTGVVAEGALFNIETVPSEALFYSMLTTIRKPEECSIFYNKFATEQLLQFGGHATTGLGYCTVKIS